MEDLERNDGTEENPYFMSNNLKKLLGVKNKFEGTDNGGGSRNDLQLGGSRNDLQMEPVESSEKP